MGNMNGATSIATKFPSLLGFGKNQHSLAHGWNKRSGAEALGKWDRFRAEQLYLFPQPPAKHQKMKVLFWIKPWSFTEAAIVLLTTILTTL